MISLERYNEDLQDLFPEGTEEYRGLLSITRLLNSSAPSTLAESQIRVSALDSARADLCNLIYYVSIRITKVAKEYSILYNKEFVKYTNLGRPNQTAVDCEVLSRNSSILDLKYKIESYESIRSLLQQYIRSIDQSRSTCIQLWNDNRFN